MTADSARSTGPLLTVGLARRDQYPLVTVLAVGVVVIAAGMAVFGLPPVDLHGPLHRVGIMGPFCGGTRAARFAAQGDLATAWEYNPAGILAVLLAGTAVVRAVVGLTTRRWLTWSLTWTPRRRRAVIVVAVLVLAALMVRQQMHADLLIAGTWTF